MRFCDEIAVFVATNLGTHLALSVPPNITAGDLKSKLRREHLSSFTNLGEVMVHGLMVKRKSHFYHLPDQMPIKSAFQGLSGPWFLQMDASWLQDMPRLETYRLSITPEREEQLKVNTTMDKSNDQSIEFEKNEDSISSISVVMDSSLSETTITFRDKNRSPIYSKEQLQVPSVPTFTEKNKINRRTVKDITEGNLTNVEETNVLAALGSGLHPERDNQPKEKTTIAECVGEDQNNNNLLSEHLSENREREIPAMSFSEKISVAGIISRYFSEFDEVNSCSGQPTTHKLEEIQQNEIIDSTMKASVSSLDQKSPTRMVESDTDTICSFHNYITSDVKQFEANFVNMNAVTAFTRVRTTINTSGGKMKKTRNESKSKAGIPKRMFSSQLSFGKHMGASSCKFSSKREVGKRLIQAANHMSISGSRRGVSNSIFVSRHGNLSAPESSALVRNNAFEIDDFND